MSRMRRHIPIALVALLIGLASAPSAPARRVAVSPPVLVWARCVSSTLLPCLHGHATTVTRTGQLEAGAHGLRASTRVLFPVRTPHGRALRHVGGHLTRSTRLLVRVPADAVSGVVRLVTPGARASNGVRITVRRPPPPPAPAPTPPSAAALTGTGMWIWYLSASSGGDPAAIGQQAAAAGVRTVYVKSGDGTGAWSQFTAASVAALKAEGLHVCAWQYVYGNQPVQEAQVGIASAAAGADCLVIDAEGEYEGKYAQAQQYIATLRAGLGAAYPIGLASFPYVDYHPAFPFSVFLGPGGAQFNLPQIYWQEIGTTPDTAYAHTWPLNRVYGAPIFPLGQIYGNPPAADVMRFRQLAAAYGASGVSWWDWQEATAAGWSAVGSALTPLGTDPSSGAGVSGSGAGSGSAGSGAGAGTYAPTIASTTWPTLATKAKGDLVVWAQEHLNGAGATLTVDGQYGALTQAAVSAFQTAHGIAATGVLDATTWPALLAVTPAIPNWGTTATPASLRPGGYRTGPASSRLPAVRDEIGAHGRG